MHTREVTIQTRQTSSETISPAHDCESHGDPLSAATPEMRSKVEAFDAQIRAMNEAKYGIPDHNRRVDTTPIEMIAPPSNYKSGSVTGSGTDRSGKQAQGSWVSGIDSQQAFLGHLHRFSCFENGGEIDVATCTHQGETLEPFLSPGSRVLLFDDGDTVIVARDSTFAGTNRSSVHNIRLISNDGEGGGGDGLVNMEYATSLVDGQKIIAHDFEDLPTSGDPIMPMRKRGPDEVNQEDSEEGSVTVQDDEAQSNSETDQGFTDQEDSDETGQEQSNEDRRTQKLMWSSVRLSVPSQVEA